MSTTQTRAAAPGDDEPETEIGLTRAAVELPQAWSADEDETPLEWPLDDDDETVLYADIRKAEPARHPWGEAWSAAVVILIVAAVVAIAILAVWSFRHGGDMDTTPAPTPAAAPIASVPDDQIVPTPVAPPPVVALPPPPPPTQTVTVTPTPPIAAAPPAQTVTPPRPSAATLDEQFLNDLTSAGMAVADVNAAIYGGHATCAYLGQGHTAAEAEETGMRNNASMTRANAITYVNAAIAVYCPQYGG